MTFLFTDLEGSTCSGTTTRRRCGPPSPVTTPFCSDVFERTGGYVFTTAGDSFAVAFPDADSAVNAGVALQREMYGDHLRRDRRAAGTRRDTHRYRRVPRRRLLRLRREPGGADHVGSVRRPDSRLAAHRLVGQPHCNGRPRPASPQGDARCLLDSSIGRRRASERVSSPAHLVGAAHQSARATNRARRPRAEAHASSTCSRSID